MLDHTSQIVGLALGLTALMGAVFGWLRWIRPRWRKAVARLNAALDTIAGREPVTDSITGRELAPALPSIGERMDTMERTVSALAQAQTHQATQDRRIDDLDRRVKSLEDGTIERVATKAESVSAWRAVEAVAKQADRTTPEIEDQP